MLKQQSLEMLTWKIKKLGGLDPSLKIYLIAYKVLKYHTVAQIVKI